MDTNCWTALGAIGQWLCAIATFCAVIVALKPYKRGVKVKLSSLRLKLGKDSQVLPLFVLIDNNGMRDETIDSYGVCDRDMDCAFDLFPQKVEAESRMKIPLAYKDLMNALSLLESNKFRVWVSDQRGNRYLSRTYLKSRFAENKTIKKSLQ